MNILSKIPETYIVLLVLLMGYSPPFNFSPFSIGFAIVIAILFALKNKIVGLVIAGIFTAINIYFLLALLSEFNEFTEFSTSAANLLFTGLAIFSINVATSILLFYKYGALNKLSQKTT